MPRNKRSFLSVWIGETEAGRWGGGEEGERADRRGGGISQKYRDEMVVTVVLLALGEISFSE